MTITEASAVNVVLRDLLGRHQLEEDEAEPGDLFPEDARLVDAAATLAEKAYRALHAGLTPDEVRAALNGRAS